MRTVLIVLFDGVQSLDVTGPLEVFAEANRRPSGRDHNSLSTCSRWDTTWTVRHGLI
jgi:hypothetical protein